MGFIIEIFATLVGFRTALRAGGNIQIQVVEGKVVGEAGCIMEELVPIVVHLLMAL